MKIKVHIYNCYAVCHGINIKYDNNARGYYIK